MKIITQKATQNRLANRITKLAIGLLPLAAGLALVPSAIAAECIKHDGKIFCNPITPISKVTNVPGTLEVLKLPMKYTGHAYICLSNQTGGQKRIIARHGSTGQVTSIIANPKETDCKRITTGPRYSLEYYVGSQLIKTGGVSSNFYKGHVMQYLWTD